jgi:subtilisin-like proprotein convertase family protein
MNLVRKFIVGIAAALAVPGMASAQVFSGSGPGGAIPDGTGSNVSGAPLITTANITGSGPIQSVTIDMSALAHTFVGDVTMRLTHPNGTTFLDLQSRPGRGAGSINPTFGFAGDFVAVNTYSFSDTGVDLYNVDQPGIIASGIYRTSSNPNTPDSPSPPPNPWVYSATSLDSTFGGLNAFGTWSLEIRDWAGADIGSLGGWTINVTVVPEPTSLALVGVGFGGLVWRPWRRRS